MAKSPAREAIRKRIKPMVRSAGGGETFGNVNGKNGARNGKWENEPSRVLPLDDSELADF